MPWKKAIFEVPISKKGNSVGDHNLFTPPFRNKTNNVFESKIYSVLRKLRLITHFNKNI